MNGHYWVIYSLVDLKKLQAATLHQTHNNGTMFQKYKSDSQKLSIENNTVTAVIYE
ncbi:MAG: hypothetical protein ACI9UN_004730 [Granulosicoccus sp.]|jgi:hypothetical protein